MNAVATLPVNEITTTRQSLGWLTPESFERAEQIAGLMSRMGTMPQHLVGKPADCFRIVVQAGKWGMDPFSVAECTSLVHGRMCFEGKLVAAVLKAMNALDGRLKYVIEGEGQASKITITGRPRGSDEDCKLSGAVSNWRTHTKTKEGQTLPNHWDKDPHSALIYRGTRQWARLYAPEALMGIYTPDEVEEIHDVQVIAVDGQVRTNVPESKPAKNRKAPASEPAADHPMSPIPAAPAAVESAPTQSTSGTVAPAPAATTVPAAGESPAMPEGFANRDLSVAVCRSRMNQLYFMNSAGQAEGKKIMAGLTVKKVDELGAMPDVARALFIQACEKAIVQMGGQL
jgi:hypothetical protein